MDKTTEIVEPFRDLKPAPDALFGDGAELDGECDAEALWPLMSGGEVSFFNLPLLEQLHRRPYHLIKLRGEFNPAKLLRDHSSQLLRSESDQTQNKKTHVERLMFCLGEGVYAVYEARKLMVYAPTTQAAAQAAKQMKKYRKPDTKQPGFWLVSLSSGHPNTEKITVEQPAPVNEQELALHYGDDFLDWERTWLERLRQRRSGVTVLHGPPGCGKTSYLLGLMARLVGKFEFYYIPVSAFDVLSSPSFVSFWIEEQKEARCNHRMAILEDAEELLLPRDAGSREKVSNLLNIGDGFLGQHLKLHVVATTNSAMRKVDPAMLRPGRLMGSREFRRLTRPEAQRLAQAKGLVLSDQKDFSLAEMYCGSVASPVSNIDRHIGFA